MRTSDLEGVADFTLNDVALGISELPVNFAESEVESTAALGAALKALTDQRSRIEVKVPLRGRLDAPDFDLDGLVVRALGRAALAAVEAPPKGE